MVQRSRQISLITKTKTEWQKFLVTTITKSLYVDKKKFPNPITKYHEKLTVKNVIGVALGNHWKPRENKSRKYKNTGDI